MEGIFRFDSRLYRTVEKLVNLVKLNFCGYCSVFRL